ncbi:hypothetical protein ACIA5H_02270 [Nocardia sp. NPDC051900]|uniref:hypothetical protein n=1 Tax=Nocardia sp. NPDC051900 TaxID=3364326 RepID=UPI0037918084
MTELRAFRQVCYEVARRTGGTVIEFRLAGNTTPNFHQGVIAYHDHHVAVVALRDSAVLAVAAPWLPGQSVGRTGDLSNGA